MSAAERNAEQAPGSDAETVRCLPLGAAIRSCGIRFEPFDEYMKENRDDHEEGENYRAAQYERTETADSIHSDDGEKRKRQGAARGALCQPSAGRGGAERNAAGQRMDV